MVSQVVFSRKKDDWETPDDLFQKYHKKYRFTVDGAANKENRKLKRWWGPGSKEAVDSLHSLHSWKGERVWVNPPYGRTGARFIEKAAFEFERGRVFSCLLLPARTDTRWFHRYCYKKPGVEIEFLPGRIKFVGGEHPAPFPSMIIIFGE